MVLITECFPTQRELLLSYFEKFKNGELNAEDVIETKSKFTDFETNRACDDESYEGSIIETKSEPTKEPKKKDKRKVHYMKNFSKFISRTNKHLDQILENQKKIDFVHEIVEKIREPLNESDKYKIAEIIEDSKMPSVASEGYDEESFADDSDGEIYNDDEDDQNNEELLQSNDNYDSNIHGKKNIQNKFSTITTKPNYTKKEFFPESKKRRSRTVAGGAGTIRPSMNHQNLFKLKPSKNIYPINSVGEKINSDMNSVRSSGYGKNGSKSNRNTNNEKIADAKIYSVSYKSDKTLLSSLKESVHKPVETAKVELAFELPKAVLTENRRKINTSRVKASNDEQRVYPKTIIKPKITMAINKCTTIAPSLMKNELNKRNINLNTGSSDAVAATATATPAAASTTNETITRTGTYFKPTIMPRSSSSDIHLCTSNRSLQSISDIFNVSTLSDSKVFFNMGSKYLKSRITPIGLYKKYNSEKPSNGIKPLGLKHSFDIGKLLQSNSRPIL